VLAPVESEFESRLQQPQLSLGEPALPGLARVPLELVIERQLMMVELVQGTTVLAAQPRKK
jgi:hypothetical protein